MTEPVYFPRLMEVVPIDIFGVHVDVPFASPLGFKQADLEEFGAKVCEPAKGLGLRPDQIRLKKWDELYGYELSAQFFGENGSLSRTADRIKLGVRNARTAGDWTIETDGSSKAVRAVNRARPSSAESSSAESRHFIRSASSGRSRGA